MTGISFLYPSYLFLVLLLPVIVFLHFYLLKARRGAAIKLANFEAFERIKGIDLYSKNLAVVVMTLIIISLLILVISGLQVQQEVSSSTFSYAIAIDVSQSMQANDLVPTRLDVAKKTADGFIDSTPAGTNIAILTFSGNAFIEQGLTQDKSLAKQAVDNIQLSTIGGTDVAEAIVSATNILASENSKSVILMSDGQINVGNLQDGIDYATKNNVVVHTIGLGTEAGGQTAYGLSTIDEDSLKSIAFATGGKYFRVKTEADFVDSLNQILQYRLKLVSFDMRQPLLIVAFVLVIIEYILFNTRYRTFP